MVVCKEHINKFHCAVVTICKLFFWWSSLMIRSGCQCKDRKVFGRH